MNAEQLIRTFGKPSRAHSTREFEDVVRVVEASKKFMRAEAENFIASSGEKTLLMCYQGDGTPIRTIRRIRSKSKGDELDRRGVRVIEYYIHNVVVAGYPTPGQRVQHIMLEDPRPMTHGKKAPAELSLGTSFIPKPRALGHKGIEILHHAFDRAHFESISGLWRRWWTDHLLKGEGFPADMDREDAFIMSWVVGTPCAAHDGHTALKWGQHENFGDKAFLKDVFIMLASVTNCSKQVMDYVPKWLASVLTPLSQSECPAEKDLLALWTILGVKDKSAVELAKLRVHFKGGKLLHSVEAASEGDEPVACRVGHLLLRTWLCRLFVEGRWASIGLCARSYIASVLTGMHDCVLTMLADATEGHYLLSGYKHRYSDRAVRFLAVSALYSYPVEAHSHCIIKDARVVKHLGKLRSAVADEFLSLSCTNDFVWEAIGSVASLTGQELRTETLDSASASMAFLYFRCYDPATKEPWSYVHDTEDKLAALSEGPELPAEPTIRKAAMCLQRGLSVVRVANALRMLEEIPWYTGLAEQQHASGSMVARYHPQIEQHGLVVRAACHTIRKLLPEDSCSAKSLARARAKLIRLQRKRPQRAGIWQLHCKDCMDIASDLKETGKRKLDTQYQRQIFAPAAKVYNKYREEWGARLAATRDAHVAEKERQLAEGLRDTYEQIEQLRGEVAQEGKEDRPFSWRTCSWAPADLQTIDGFLKTDSYGAAAAHAKSTSALEAPPPPSATRLQELLSIPVGSGLAAAPWPSWVRTVAVHRTEFRKTLFLAKGDDAFAAYFGFAMQGPTELWFARAYEVEALAVTSENPFSASALAPLSRYAQVYQLAPMEFFSWERFAGRAADGIDVVRGVEFADGGRLFADSEPTPLPEVLCALPESVSSRKKENAAEDGVGEATDLAMYKDNPWLEDAISHAEEAGGPSSDRSKAKAASAVPLLPLASDSGEFADLLAEKLVELEQLKEWVSSTGGDDEEHWRVVPTGSASHIKLTGEAFDNIVGKVRNHAVAQAWAMRHGVGMQMGFATKTYGVARANDLAQLYCKKLQWFFDQFLANGSQEPDSYEPFEEPAGFDDFLVGLNAQAIHHVNGLRNLAPRAASASSASGGASGSTSASAT